MDDTGDVKDNDRLRALEMLGKALGSLTEQVHVESKITIQYEDLRGA